MQSCAVLNRKFIFKKEYIYSFLLIASIIFGIDTFLEDLLGFQTFYISYLLEFFCILFYVVSHKIGKSTFNYKIKIIIAFYIIPIIYSFLIFFVHKVEFNYYSRAISTTLWTIIGVLSAYFFVKELGAKAVNLFFYTCCVLYLSFVIYTVIDYGIIETIKELVSFNFNDSEVFSLLERHQLIFCFSLFFVYYLFKSKTRGRFTKILISLFFLFIGFKRIVFIGLILVILLKLIFLLFRYRKDRIILGLMLSIFSIVVGFLFVYMIKSGVLEELLSIYNIDSMSRMKMYNEMGDTYYFGLNFLGNGRGFTTRYFDTNLSLQNQNAGALHSDILTLYIDLGFMGFFIYSLYFLFLIPYFISRKFKEDFTLLFALAVYTYFLYFTDNTLTYNFYIILFYMIYFVPKQQVRKLLRC